MFFSYFSASVHIFLGTVFVNHQHFCRCVLLGLWSENWPTTPTVPTRCVRRFRQIQTITYLFSNIYDCINLCSSQTARDDIYLSKNASISPSLVCSKETPYLKFDGGAAHAAREVTRTKLYVNLLRPW